MIEGKEYIIYPHEKEVRDDILFLAHIERRGVGTFSYYKYEEEKDKAFNEQRSAISKLLSRYYPEFDRLQVTPRTDGTFKITWEDKQ